MGRPGFWQIVLIVALVALFFHRPLVQILRALLGGGGGASGDGGARRAAGAPSRVGASCPHCGAQNPQGAKYCNDCGRPLDFIDV